MAAEIAPAAIKAMYPRVKAREPSMEISGIIGGVRSRGYHRSRNRLRALGLGGNYSIVDDPRDRKGNGDNASAIDMKLSPAAMIRVSKRLIAAGKRNDPRLAPMREFFGTVDGRHVTGWSPFRDRTVTSADPTHLWHIHVSITRQFSDDAKACAGIADVIVGVPLTIPQPKHYWLSLLLESRLKEMLAPRTVRTHKETVLVVERALRTWGYAGNLVVDGHYGTSTDTAVKWFQSKVSESKDPDGVLGEKEWARLAGGPDGKALFVPEMGNYQRWI